MHPLNLCPSIQLYGTFFFFLVRCDLFILERERERENRSMEGGKGEEEGQVDSH